MSLDPVSNTSYFEGAGLISNLIPNAPHFKGAGPIFSLDIAEGTENPELRKQIHKLDGLAGAFFKGDLLSEPFLDGLFHAAIDEGKIDVVRSFIRQGFSVSTLVEGMSPLYRACKNGQVEIAQLLLENGASATQKNNLSRRQVQSDEWYYKHHNATPMESAVIAGNQNLVNLLLKYKAPFDEPTLADGRSPLFIAIHHRQEELALFFIKNGANIKIKDRFGISLFTMAVRCGSIRVVQELVKRGIDISEQDEDGLTALHETASKDNPELLKFLLENGGRDIINVQSFHGRTPLSVAVRGIDIESVKLLVESGADLSITYEGDEKGEVYDIVGFAKKVLSRTESFYKEEPRYREGLGKLIQEERAIVELLQKAIEKNNMTKEQPIV